MTKEKVTEIIKKHSRVIETIGDDVYAVGSIDIIKITTDLVKLFAIPVVSGCFIVDKSKADRYNESDMCVQLYNCKCGNTDLFESDKYCSDCGTPLEFK